MSTFFGSGGGFLHNGPATFFGRPYQVKPNPDTKVVIFGVPWDEGNGGRNGANYGPRAVRDVSSWFFSHDMRNDRDLWADLPALDGGDVACYPADAAKTIDSIADHARALVASGVRPVMIGGNHSVTIGSVRGAASAIKGKVGYLSIDAHLDTPKDWEGSALASGCPTYVASQQPNISPENCVVFGARGWLNAKEHIETADQLGIRWYGMDEIEERGLKVTLAEAIARASDGVDALYVTFDIDSIDSSVAPGCGTPEAGGFSGREALYIAREIGKAKPFFFDIVEIAPIYDNAGITPRLVCSIILDMLSSMPK